MRKRSWLGSALLLAASFLLSCLWGRYPMTPADLWEILSGQAAGAMGEAVFWNIRVARSCVAARAGRRCPWRGSSIRACSATPWCPPTCWG